MRSDHSNPEASALVVGNTQTGEGYLSYLGMAKGDGKPAPLYASGASFSLEDTDNPAIGLAKGNLEFTLSGIDWNKPAKTSPLAILTLGLVDAPQQVNVQDNNFGPGALVEFENKNHAFPLMKDFVFKGKGVRFVIPTAQNPLGVRSLAPETRLIGRDLLAVALAPG